MATVAPGSSSEDTNLIAEVEALKDDCTARYKFNSRWDNVLTVFGILLSVAIVAAGTYEWVKTATILGALVAAVVTTQRAFPFGQRAMFYRVLIGQSANLITELKAGLIAPKDSVAALKSLRLDFAQQLPRGSTTRPIETDSK
jgi:hypothetical protein